MALTELLIYPPQSSTAGYKVQAEMLDFEWQMQFPGAATITIKESWDFYQNENDTNNPIQLNAYVTYKEDGVFIYRGNVVNIRRIVEGGEAFIALDCLDKQYILSHTLVAYQQYHNPAIDYIWRRQTVVENLTNVRLYVGENYTTNIFQYTYYPIYSSSAWLGTASSQLFKIGADMPNNTTNITSLKLKNSAGVKGYPGLPPAGFFSVASEWCQYNGLQYNESDQFWYALNIRRARLGTSAAAHTDADDAYGRLSKRISAETRVLIEGVYSGDTNNTPIADVNYEINHEDGSFIFGLNPLDLRAGTDYDYMQASYGVYKEDSGTPADILLLSEVFTDILNISAANGGPAGLQDTITLSPDPVITCVKVQEPITQAEFIRRILDELALAKGTSNDLIGVWYNSSTDYLHIDTLAQAATPNRYYHGERSRAEEMSLEDIKSAVLVTYEDGGNFNLLGGTRFWHTAATISGAYPHVWHKAAGTWAQPVACRPNANNSTYDDIAGACTITDNDTTTGFALEWDTDVTTGGDNLLHGWFPGTSDTAPGTWYIKRVIAVFELKGTITAPMEITIKGIGINDFAFTYPSEPTGTIFDISPALTQTWGVTNDAYPAGVEYTTAEIKAEGLFVPAQGIVLYVKILADSNVGPTAFTLKILDLYVEGVQLQTELVKLSGAYSTGDTNTLVAPGSYAKLYDSNTAQHHCQILPVGPATREVAVNLGWLQLLQTLALAQSRIYQIDSTSIDESGIPIVGETIQMSDGFSGLCDNIRYRLKPGGERELEIRLIDYNTTLFGSGV